MSWTREVFPCAILFKHKLPKNREAIINISWKESRRNRWNIRLLIVKDGKIIWKINKAHNQNNHKLKDHHLQNLARILENKLEELGEYDE